MLKKLKILCLRKNAINNILRSKILFKFIYKYNCIAVITPSYF